MEASCERGTNSTGSNSSASSEKATGSFQICETHDSDGEVVVDDLVRHGVALLLVPVRGDLHAPAVHQHHRTALDVFQDAAQVLPVVACGGRRTGRAQS